MQSGLKLTPVRMFYLLMGLYLIAGFLNLTFLPIAWTDEVLNLDPALQWHKHGHYASFLWPNQGSDKIFLAYPPLIGWFHIAWLYVAPFDIFWTRLPFFLIYCTALLMLWSVMRLRLKDTWPALLLFAFFMFDKVAFEISRSMRVEVLEVFLVSALFYLRGKNLHKPVLTGLLLGLLLAAHLKMWPWVFIWLLLDLKENPGFKNLLRMGLSAALPMLIFIVFIRFDLAEWFHQMFAQAQKHRATGNILHKVYEHFVGSFWPVYREQPWNLFLPSVIFVVALIQIFQERWQAREALLFTVTFMVWVFALAPHYRYWPPLYLTGVLVLAGYKPLVQIISKLKPQFLIVVMPLLMAGFIGRHCVAAWQHRERELKPVLAWLNHELNPQRKTLVLGNAAAFYASEKQNLDYGMEMYPQNLRFADYQDVFFLSTDSASLELLSEYEKKRGELPGWLKLFGRGDTYAGLKLYRVSSDKDWEMLTGRYADDYL